MTPVRSVYLHAVCFAAIVIAVLALAGVVTNTANLIWLDPEFYFRKVVLDLVSNVVLLIVSVVVYIVHWRKAERLEKGL